MTASLGKAIFNGLVQDGRRGKEGAWRDLATELVHSLINLFNKCFPSPVLGTRCTAIKHTWSCLHGVRGLLNSQLGGEISKWNKQVLRALQEEPGCRTLVGWEEETSLRGHIWAEIWRRRKRRKQGAWCSEGTKSEPAGLERGELRRKVKDARSRVGNWILS